MAPSLTSLVGKCGRRYSARICSKVHSHPNLLRPWMFKHLSARLRSCLHHLPVHTQPHIALHSSGRPQHEKLHRFLPRESPAEVGHLPGVSTSSGATLLCLTFRRYHLLRGWWRIARGLVVRHRGTKTGVRHFALSLLGDYYDGESEAKLAGFIHE